MKILTEEQFARVVNGKMVWGILASRGYGIYGDLMPAEASGVRIYLGIVAGSSGKYISKSAFFHTPNEQNTKSNTTLDVMKESYINLGYVRVNGLIQQGKFVDDGTLSVGAIINQLETIEGEAINLLAASLRA